MSPCRRWSQRVSMRSSAGFPRSWPGPRRRGQAVYAGINGLTMFYEIRGTSDSGTVPLVLLHGAISATGTSFGPLPDLLAQTRQVIAVEQQGHGRDRRHRPAYVGPGDGR